MRMSQMTHFGSGWQQFLAISAKWVFTVFVPQTLANAKELAKNLGVDGEVLVSNWLICHSTGGACVAADDAWDRLVTAARGCK